MNIKKITKVKMNRKVANTIDALCTNPMTFRLKHDKKLSPNQKRVIRRAFNKIQPEFVKVVSKAFHNFHIYGYHNNLLVKES